MASDSKDGWAETASVSAGMNAAAETASEPSEPSMLESGRNLVSGPSFTADAAAAAKASAAHMVLCWCSAV